MLPPASVAHASITEAERLTALRDDALHRIPVTRVPVDSLVVTDSPRAEGEDATYTASLAEVEGDLPAIVVHAETRHVIDGAHRLAAARLAGREEIDARFFSGSQEDAYLLSVACNITHGRPLSQPDRMSAASRIVHAHPRWSDRSVAVVTGLSAHKVAEIRHGERGVTEHESRIGQDGRVRPLNAARGRRIASEMIKSDPAATLRQVARRAGISPATVADVRERLARGADPVPDRQRSRAAGEAAAGPVAVPVEPGPEAARGTDPTSVPAPREGDRARMGAAPARRPASAEELTSIAEILRKDPSLRFNEIGRLTLRLFDAAAVFQRRREELMENIPVHCREPVAFLLHGYGQMWQSLADELL